MPPPLGPSPTWKCPLDQRERCWKQLRTSSGASPMARYSGTYRHCGGQGGRAGRRGGGQVLTGAGVGHCIHAARLPSVFWAGSCHCRPRHPATSLPEPTTMQRTCQLSFFSSMPSAKSSVRVHSGNQPACGARSAAQQARSAGSHRVQASQAAVAKLGAHLRDAPWQ